MDYDVFISHASEDKESVARPVARHLQELGLKVWIDECELTLGDSLRRKIDAGLARSRYGVVVLSPAFFGKEWPNKELDGLVAREDGSGKVVLPVWHNVNASDVLKYSPILAGKVAVSTARGIPHVAAAVHAALQVSTGQSIEASAKLASLELETLERMRRDMLTADSSRELRRASYEVEGHLARYPHSVEARELQDQLNTALHSAERYEHPPARSAPPSRRRSSGPGFLFIGILIAIIVYAVLRYFGLT